MNIFGAILFFSKVDEVFNVEQIDQQEILVIAVGRRWGSTISFEQYGSRLPWNEECSTSDILSLSKLFSYVAVYLSLSSIT